MALFSAPSTGGGDTCKPKDVLGHLLIVKPKGVREMTTAFGDAKAVEVDVADVDTGESYRNALWFGAGLVAGLEPQIKKIVLGTMGQGTAKPGQSAPWQLQDATEDAGAVARAEAWLAAHPDFNSSFSAPAAQAAPAPAAQPAAQPTLPANAADDPNVAALLQKMLEKQQQSAGAGS